MITDTHRKIIKESNEGKRLPTSYFGLAWKDMDREILLEVIKDLNCEKERLRNYFRERGKQN